MSGYISVTFFFWVCLEITMSLMDTYFFTGCCFNPPKAIRTELAIIYVMWIFLGTFLFHFSEKPVEEAGFWSVSSHAFCNPSPFTVSCKEQLKSLLTFESIAKKVTVIFFFFFSSQVHPAVLEGKGREGQGSLLAYFFFCLFRTLRFRFTALKDGWLQEELK